MANALLLTNYRSNFLLIFHGEGKFELSVKNPITWYHFRIYLIQFYFVKLSEVSEQIMVRSPQNCQAWETCQRCQTAVKKRDFTFGHCQEQYGWTTVEVCEDSKSSLQLERFQSTWIQVQKNETLFWLKYDIAFWSFFRFFNMCQKMDIWTLNFGIWTFQIIL